MIIKSIFSRICKYCEFFCHKRDWMPVIIIIKNSGCYANVIFHTYKSKPFRSNKIGLSFLLLAMESSKERGRGRRKVEDNWSARAKCVDIFVRYSPEYGMQEPTRA